MNWFTQNKEQLILQIYVQPGAKRTEITGLHGDALKIRLRTPPIEGKANEALLSYLAECFQVPKKHVVLKKGEKSRHKIVVITGSQIHPLSIYT